MLIRSQNRESLIVLENVLTFYEEYNAGFYDIGAVLPLNGDPFNDGEPPVWYLGKYTTREKALKVLDMIEDTYKGYKYHKSGLKEFGTYVTGTEWDLVPEFAFTPPKVFQMPQDSEVDE